jgi:ABC-type dipeptide/oligopeptide/nickel transport system ATPase subunit
VNVDFTLESAVATSFRCVKAANSLDIDPQKKSTHHFALAGIDLETPFNVGLVVGASGSGKTTLAQHIWGAECFHEMLDMTRPVIDQFPEHYSYDECAAMLAGVGLTSVVCWIRPAYTLSNGQRARAEAALRMAQPVDGTIVVMDEWTSVVDRTVGKVMSHCIQKHARKFDKRIVLCSCHYDVHDWLNPDWVIDCNKQEYTDRRSLRRNFARTEQLHFDIRRVERRTWKYFSKYHYLSDKLPGGHIEVFGLFKGDDQIGFQCFANYTPFRKSDLGREKMHSNRTVIHPDYAGLGMGIQLINKTSAWMTAHGYEVWAKFSSTPIYLHMARQAEWQLVDVKRNLKTVLSGNMLRDSGFREGVKTYSFRYVGQNAAGATASTTTTEAPPCQ